MDPTCDLLWLVPDGCGCVSGVRVFRAGTWEYTGRHHVRVPLDGRDATIHAADCRALAPGATFVRDGLPMYAAAPVKLEFGDKTWVGVTVANGDPLRGILAGDGGADEPVVVGG